MKKHFDLAIIGAGPAGLTAGVYAARGGLSAVIIEKSSAGGLAATAVNVENYPGVLNASGFDLCFNMQRQCLDLGVEFAFDRISSCNISSPVKTINLESGDTITCDKLILATGASPKKLGVDGEEKFSGRGVSYCATCDGALFKNKTVAVVGGGNTAVEDALYLERLAKKVYLIHRRDTLRADKILSDRLAASGVVPIWGSVIASLDGDDVLTQATVKNVKSGALTPVLLDCVFVAIGQTANINGFETLENDNGYVLTDDNMRTSISGVYAAGDIRKKPLRQIITACADGAIAANAALCDR